LGHSPSTGIAEDDPIKEAGIQRFIEAFQKFINEEKEVASNFCN
jgi:hypothetical protein